MISMTSLYSGSSGNCTLVEIGDAKILVDAGRPGNRIKQAISQTDVSLEEIDAILVTHEHDDHIAGVGVLSRRYGIPVFSNENTFLAMKSKIGKMKDENIRIFASDEAFSFKDINILPFRISHDAAEPVGFVFDDGHDRIATLTDTGIITQHIRESVTGVRSILLESNHDIDMLACGSYPEPLKQRIMGEFGHLSNDTCDSFMEDLIKAGCEHFCLGHLSHENNTPLTALNSAVRYLKNEGMSRDRDYTVLIAKRDDITDSMIL